MGRPDVEGRFEVLKLCALVSWQTVASRRVGSSHRRMVSVVVQQYSGVAMSGAVASASKASHPSVEM